MTFSKSFEQKWLGNLVSEFSIHSVFKSVCAVAFTMTGMLLDKAALAVLVCLIATCCCSKKEPLADTPHAASLSSILCETLAVWLLLMLCSFVPAALQIDTRSWQWPPNWRLARKAGIQDSRD